MPKVNAKRKAKNDQRATGGKARREFVATLPCAACGVEGYSQNAHLLGNGGMSRKQNADTIGPLCGPRPFAGRGTLYQGCHNLYDTDRAFFDWSFPAFDPAKVAADTEALWQARQSAPSPRIRTTT